MFNAKNFRNGSLSNNIFETNFEKNNIENEDTFNWKDMCVLVVEDNYTSFRLLEITLSRTGIKIIHVENGIKAIDAIRDHPEINLVLMDIQLPIMDGYEATSEIKKIRPELVIIAQTANAMDDDRQKCIFAGFNDYITKPIALYTMLSIINMYIRKP